MWDLRSSQEQPGAEMLLDLSPAHIPSSLTQPYAQIERWKDSKRKEIKRDWEIYEMDRAR